MRKDYGHHFIVYRKDGREHARRYLAGLMGTQRRKNMGRIEEDVPETNYQGLQHFMSDSAWEHEPLMAQLAGEASRLLGGKRDRRPVYRRDELREKRQRLRGRATPVLRTARQN
jgi:SRSO17 transposase